ncbi:MAG: hypothetical protein JO250_01755 [Armatimonadetes bacterium]|nr:hypothetical protein [Armatimonadota bacterium]
MHTNLIGNISEAVIMAAFAKAGYLVSKPFGNAHPYDLIVDDGTRLLRVQCKTARQVRGTITFSTKSNNGRWYRRGANRGYAGKADLFAAYCPNTDKVYVASAVDAKPGSISLRLTPTANNQSKKIRWAHEYELRPLK